MPAAKEFILPSQDVILASQSPRRRALLKKIVSRFRVVPSGLDEEKSRSPDPVTFALAAAAAKAGDVGKKFPSSLVIAADTLVCLENEISASRARPAHMLKSLPAGGTRHNGGGSYKKTMAGWSRT
jgi:septum formation protein